MHIYCVNLPSSTERRARMENRFRYHNLLDQVTFVDGINWDDPIIDRYNYGREGDDINDIVWRKGYGCFIGHLKAIRTFLETTDESVEGAYFCEDDIMLVNNFKDALVEMWHNAPDNVTLISLSYMLVNGTGCQPVGKYHKESFFTISPEYHFGCQLYWLSRNYAKYALEKFDRPFKQLDEEGYLRSSEVIIKRSGGVFYSFKLAVEECIDSDRQPLDVPYHKNHFFNHLRLYNAADVELVERQLANWH